LARSKNGEAISASRKTPQERRKLRSLLAEAKRLRDLETWRRAKAVLGYIGGIKVIALAEKLDVTRGSINRWLQWFDAQGTEGLRPRERPGGVARLTGAQHQELITTIEAGPQAAGFQTGIWTGPMIGDLIRRRFDVRYHNHHIPRLLHKLGFSVQRPRKRLARADAERQAVWLQKTCPAIKKKRRRVEASFSSETRPVSGSTELSTEPGPE
jgi:transposase